MVNDRKFLSEFIQLYRNFPCLWNRVDPNYRNLSQRDTAYSFLLEQMKQIDSEASKISVTNKINNIRCAYRKEHLKVLSSRENGELYEPSLWYYNMLSFLKDQLDPPKIYKRETNHDHERSSIDSDNSLNPFENSDEESVEIRKKRQLTKTHTKNCKLKTNHIASASLQSVNTNSTDHTRIITDTTTNMEIMEHASFGNNVAEELRKIPLEMVPFVKKLINDAIFEGHMISLNRFSRIVTPPKK